jgi:hypothetical protein
VVGLQAMVAQIFTEISEDLVVFTAVAVAVEALVIKLEEEVVVVVVDTMELMDTQESSLLMRPAAKVDGAAVAAREGSDLQTVVLEAMEDLAAAVEAA